MRYRLAPAVVLYNGGGGQEDLLWNPKDRMAECYLKVRSERQMVL